MSHFSAIISAPTNWLTFVLAVAIDPAGRTAEQVVEAEPCAGGHRRPDRDHRHVLHTPGNDDVHRSRHHRLGGEVHGLLRRAALAIERHAGHVLGQTGCEPARPGMHPIGAHRVDVAEHDIIDGVRIDAGTLDERGNGMRADVGGMDLRQAASRRPTGVRTASTM